MAKEVRIQLTPEQKAKIKEATGKTMEEIRVSSLGKNLAVSPGQKGLSEQGLRDDALRDDAMRDDALRDDALRDDALRDDALRDDALRDDALRNQE